MSFLKKFIEETMPRKVNILCCDVFDSYNELNSIEIPTTQLSEDMAEKEQEMVLF